MQSNYHFKIVPQSFAITGILNFIGFGFCALNVDYGTSETEIMTGKIVMVCLTIIPSFSLIWCGIAKRVFVYHDKLMSRNMFFQNSTLFFSEIKQYEYKATHSTINLISLDGKKIKINFASHKNILKLRHILTEYGIYQIADYGISVSDKVNTDIEAYTKTDIVVSGWNKKRFRWIHFSLAFLIISPIILLVDGRISGILCALAVALFACAAIFIEISFHREKLIVGSNGAKRIFSFKQAKFLRYEQIDYVVIVNSRDNLGCSYIFFSEGHEYFSVPSDFSNLNVAMNQLEKNNIKLVYSEKLR